MYLFINYIQYPAQVVYQQYATSYNPYGCYLGIQVYTRVSRGHIPHIVATHLEIQYWI